VTESVTAEAIRTHAANKQPIMVFPLMGDQTRVAVLDFDNHDGSLTWEQMAESVRPIVDSLQADGLKPSLFRSGGGGGIHVWIIWKAPQAAKRVRVYLAELLHRHGFKSGSGGVAKGEAEIFPKQSAVEPGSFGSGIALPLARQSAPLNADLTPLDSATWVPPSGDALFSDPHALITVSSGEARTAQAVDCVVLQGDFEEAEAALKNVPSDDYGLWITIGHALKGAFGEEGFRLWHEWSAKSPKAENEAALRKRWRSFRPRGDVSLGTVFHHGQQNGWNGPSEPVVRKFNARYGILTRGNRTLIIDKLAQTESDELLVTLSKATFLDRYAAYRMPSQGAGGRSRAVTEAQYWLQHPLADHYTEVIFDPSRPPGRCGKALNVWRVFAFAPAPGDWSLFQEHLLENICRGDNILYQWLINWMAGAVQQPGHPIGTVPILQGLPGTGKSIVARHFGALWKPHAVELTHSNHVTGHFNAHVFGRRFIFIDEGTFGGDKSSAGVLKTRITEPFFMLEAKGVDAIRVANRSVYMIASNNESIVAADVGDRRWMVFQVGEGRKEDHAFFSAMDKQMQTGGYQGLLYDLLHHNCQAGPDPRKVIHTAALFDQVKRNLSPEARYLYEVLDRGQLPHTDAMDRNRVTITDLLADLRKSVPNAQYATAETLGRTISKTLNRTFTKRLAGRYFDDPYSPDGVINVRSTEYTFLPLPECRARFAGFMGMPVEWSEDAADWLPGDAIM
jgi:hypothetical protein